MKNLASKKVAPRSQIRSLLLIIMSLVHATIFTAGAQEQKPTPANEAAGHAPTTPIPVVFVPGTAGSELDLKEEGTVYWLARETLGFEETLPKGLLNDDGTDTGKEEIYPNGVLGQVKLLVNSQAENVLGVFGFRIVCVSDKDLDDTNPCQDKEGAVACTPGPGDDQIKREEVKCDPCEGKTARAIVRPIYKKFLGWAEEIFNSKDLPPTFYRAPYDWRKGPMDVQRLDEAVNRALLASPGHDKVILIAHSLGGLVSREYIAGPGRGKVAALISVGTPWLGAPKAARALLWGYNFDVGLPQQRSGQVRVEDPSTGATKDKVADLVNLAFLDFEQIKVLARTWPAVFIQLPTADFMSLYGQASTPRAGSKSVVWNWDAPQTIDFYKYGLRRDSGPEAATTQGNELLFKWASDWRDHYLSGDDYGVSHYLIAGFTHEKTGFSAETEMQMTKPTDTVKRSVPSKFRRALRRVTLRAVENVTDLINVLRDFKIYRTEYLATERGRLWGDATAPLLSATAGAKLIGEDPGADELTQTVDESAAGRFLGADTHVTVRRLSPGYEHGAMLDDPKVRWELWKIYRAQNRAAGYDYDPPVTSITLELDWKIRKTSKYLVVKLGGYGLKRTGLPHDSLKTSIRRFEPCGIEAETKTPHPLRMSDVLGQALRFTLRHEGEEPGGAIDITHVRLIVNGMELLNQATAIKLTKRSPDSEPVNIQNY